MECSACATRGWQSGHPRSSLLVPAGSLLPKQGTGRARGPGGGPAHHTTTGPSWSDWWEKQRPEFGEGGWGSSAEYAMLPKRTCPRSRPRGRSESPCHPPPWARAPQCRRTRQHVSAGYVDRSDAPGTSEAAGIKRSWCWSLPGGSAPRCSTVGSKSMGHQSSPGAMQMTWSKPSATELREETLQGSWCSAPTAVHQPCRRRRRSPCPARPRKNSKQQNRKPLATWRWAKFGIRNSAFKTGQIHLCGLFAHCVYPYPHLTDVNPIMAKHWANPAATPVHIASASLGVAFDRMRCGIT